MKILGNYSIPVTVDIATLASDGNTGVKVPAGFVFTGVALKETTLATGGTSATATVKAGSTTIGEAFSIGGAAAADAFSAGTAGYVASDADLVVTLGGTTSATAGVLDIVVIGTFPRGRYADDQWVSAGDNKADDDPYVPPEKR